MRSESNARLQASISDVYAGHIFEYEDRFRVDRRKLELLMMNMYPPVPETAADFFGRIEEETGTVVIWPSRLKIGAKSKKGTLSALAEIQHNNKQMQFEIITKLNKNIINTTLE